MTRQDEEQLEKLVKTLEEIKARLEKLEELLLSNPKGKGK